MLTRIRIKNFKSLEEADIELGEAVVFIGPNNSGKTTALQALSLWEIALRRFVEKREGKDSPEKRPGITINRRDLVFIPVPETNLLWYDRHTHEGQPTKTVRLEIIVDGIMEQQEMNRNEGNRFPWSCGFEYDYAGEETFYCRPVRLSGFETSTVKDAKFTEIPAAAKNVRIALLPPMSGLSSVEPKWEPGRVNVLIGEGQTAQVLRNLCYQLYINDSGKRWNTLIEQINDLFGSRLIEPKYIKERGEITMAYEDHRGVQLDISCSGRGLQQTLLLLAFLHLNPSTVLLLDEPDAHLEILRQRQIYRVLTETARDYNSQVICASHSEVILNEAAEKDLVISFVGKPCPLNGRDSQVLKSLRDYGWEDYNSARQMGWILYLEGSTDLAILHTFAQILQHTKAIKALSRPFVHYVENKPKKVQEHFHAIRLARKELRGIAIFDRLTISPPTDMPVATLQWRKRELENYLCMEETLLAYASKGYPDDMIGNVEKEASLKAMRESIDEISKAVKILKKGEPWSDDIKASDDFLDPLFDNYFARLERPNLMRKTNYHVLASYVPKEKIDPEVIEKLDAIAAVFEKTDKDQIERCEQDGSKK